MLFGFGARHRRRQHHAGVVIPAPAPVNRLSLPWAPGFAIKKIKKKGKWWVGVFELGSVVRRTEPHVRYLLLDSARGSCLSSSLV